MLKPVNDSGTSSGNSAISVPTERRDGEEMTAFTIRQIRNEIIEDCAKAAEKSWPRAHTYASENADIYRGQDHAARTIVKAIRSLKQ